jgi:phospholipase C
VNTRSTLSRLQIFVLGVFVASTFVFSHSETLARDKDKHSLPPRALSGVDHIVVVMMENRSCDHLLGGIPRRTERKTGSLTPTRPAL